MRFSKTFILFLALFVLSCGKPKIQQGEISYSISYPGKPISDFMLAMAPGEMSLIFKGTKVMTTIKKDKLYTTQILTDESDHSVEMRLILGNQKKIYTVLSGDEIEKLKQSQPLYTIVSTSEADSLSGLWAKKYAVQPSSPSIEVRDAWFTEDLAPASACWFTSYGSVQGVPLAYDVERYDLRMRLEALNFEPREINEQEFDRDPQLVHVSFDEYEAEAQSLFDLLMK